MHCPRRSTIWIASLLLAPAASAVPVRPIDELRVAPSLGELAAQLVAEEGLRVTLGPLPAPRRGAPGESVLFSNGTEGGFGFEQDRFQELEPGE